MLRLTACLFLPRMCDYAQVATSKGILVSSFGFLGATRLLGLETQHYLWSRATC